MAAVRRTFPIATLGNYVAQPPVAVPPPRARAVPEIQNFCLVTTAQLLPAAIAADPTAQLDSTTALFNSLFMHSIVFTAALQAVAPPNAAANAALANMSLALTNAVQATGLAPLALPLPANAPAEAPLELVYETVTRSIAAPTFQAGWNAVHGIVLPAAAQQPCGHPQVSFLCFGNGQLVVAANMAAWHKFNAMDRWSTAARDNSMDNVYRTNSLNLSRRLVRNGGFRRNVFVPPQAQDLQYQWDHPVPPQTADASVMAAWNAINAALAPPVNPGPTINRPAVATAVSFKCKNGAPSPRARCRRCRVIYRYAMANGPAPAPAEPQHYDAGPFADTLLSCAEVLAYEKCRWSGL